MWFVGNDYVFYISFPILMFMSIIVVGNTDTNHSNIEPRSLEKCLIVNIQNYCFKSFFSVTVLRVFSQLCTDRSTCVFYIDCLKGKHQCYKIMVHTNEKLYRIVSWWIFKLIMIIEFELFQISLCWCEITLCFVVEMSLHLHVPCN